MRYGPLQDSSGFHNICKLSNPTTMAALSLLVVATGLQPSSSPFTGKAVN
jgi:hypothetical protein